MVFLLIWIVPAIAIECYLLSAKLFYTAIQHTHFNMENYDSNMKTHCIITLNYISFVNSKSTQKTLSVSVAQFFLLSIKSLSSWMKKMVCLAVFILIKINGKFIEWIAFDFIEKSVERWLHICLDLLTSWIIKCSIIFNFLAVSLSLKSGKWPFYWQNDNSTFRSCKSLYVRP